jgi:glutathione peroxidase
MPSVYDFHADTIDGNNVTLDTYRHKVLLIVNTASLCGLTPQFEGLEALYKKYHAQGFEILGFPCNQFGKQDPHSNSEIHHFCLKNYGVSFPMFSKIDVNGSNSHMLYQHLKQQAPGIWGTKRIKWNFTKFLINRDGSVVRRYSPKAKPELLSDDIQRALAKE